MDVKISAPPNTESSDLMNNNQIKYADWVRLLSEDNDHVKGSFHVVGVYGRGTIAGKLSGRTLSFTFDQTYPSRGTSLGTASFTGDRVTGTYSGSACRGDVTASFEVSRTPEAVPL